MIRIKLLSLSIFFSALMMQSLFAQSSDPVLFSVNGKSVHKSEFEMAYKKNNLNALSDKNDINSFLQSYIDSKLSLEEALAQKLDTTSSYKYQRDSYRIQVIAPYLENRDYADRYFSKLYNLYLEDVELNHVYIPFEKNKVFPSDTLKAYEIAIQRSKELRKNKFKEAGLVDYTKDPSLETNLETVNGYLGRVTLPMLSTAIVKTVSNMSIGEISDPIRTSNGYHIVQLLGKYPAAGYRTLDQVVFGYKSLPPKQHDIDSVTNLVQSLYEEIKSSSDFQVLCDGFAEAHDTKDKGCRFNEIGLDSKLPPSFISEAFRLQNEGDVSRPVVTNYGVHILRLVSKRGIPSQEQMRQKLIESMQNGDKGAFYMFDYQQYFTDKYGLVYNQNACRELLDIANTIYPTDSSFVERVKNMDDVLFVIDDSVKYNVRSFTNYLLAVSSTEDIKDEDVLARLFGIIPVDPFTLSTDKLESILRQFATMKLHNYLRNTIDKKIPEIRNQVKEYTEGTLIYDIKNKEVWSKTDDQAALKSFFEKNKSKYKWDSPRYKGFVIHSSNEAVLDTVRQALRKVKSEEELKNVIRNEFKNDSIADSVKIDEGLWSKGQNKYVDYEAFSGGNPTGTSHHHLVVGKLIRKPEVLEDVKGEVIADYQDELEKKWLQGLRKKYNVVIDETVLKSIKEYE